jgi:hypothetical protein
MFTGDGTVCVGKARLNVAGLKKWKFLQDGFDSFASGLQAKDLFIRDPHSANDRFASENIRIDGNSRQIFFRHCETSGTNRRKCRLRQSQRTPYAVRH